MKNIFVSFEDGDNLLLHVIDDVTVDECRSFAERASLKAVVDVYEIKDEEIQYYIIDNRFWIDTSEKVKALRTIIN